MGDGTQKSCSCSSCQNACENVPGWFMPGEIEETAKKMGLTTKEFFDKYCSVNWWENGPNGDIFVIAPANSTSDLGGMYAGNPRGRCDSYKNGLCGLHEYGKPYECAQYIHDDDYKDVIDKRHRAVADAWDKPEHQKQIEKLLGYEPYATGTMSIFDFWW